MEMIADLIKDLVTVPTERLYALVALAALALAAFTVHAILSIAKEKKGER
jgi:hypothetical protein